MTYWDSVDFHRVFCIFLGLFCFLQVVLLGAQGCEFWGQGCGLLSFIGVPIYEPGLFVQEYSSEEIDPALENGDLLLLVRRYLCRSI